MAHEHHGVDEAGAFTGTARDLKLAVGLLSVILVAEVLGAYISHSLALLADAGHVLMDLFSLIISLGAARLATLPATSKRTYGWHRAEILAALINGILLTALAFGLFREAWVRLLHPREVLAMPMLVIAAIGLAANLWIAVRLHGASHDLNVRSAYLHVLGDTGASIGVIGGALVIEFTGWNAVDSWLSAMIGVVILIGAVRLILRASHILLEGVPSRLSHEAVSAAIREIDEVEDVHDVHIWTLCSHIINLTCHIKIAWRSPEHHDNVVRHVRDMLWQRFSILHSTIQVDYVACDESVIGKDMVHPELLSEGARSDDASASPHQG